MRHAIVGAGFGADVHLPAFRSLASVEVVALADSGSGRARARAGSGVRAWSNWRDMLTRERLDTLSVAVPPPAQREIVEEAARRGLHVLCEKPLGADLEQARAMQQALAGSGRVGAVGFQFRYEPGLAELRRRVRAGEIGRLQRLDVSWLSAGRADPERPWCWQHDAASGGGVIHALLSHVLDLVLWIDGTGVTRIAGSAGVVIPERPDGSGGMRAVSAEDRVDAVAELASGAVASLRVSNCQARGPGMRFEAHGETGHIVFAHVWPFRPSDASLRIDSQVGNKRIALDPRGAGGGEHGDTRIPATAALAADFATAVSVAHRAATACDAEPAPAPPGFDAALRVHEVAGRLRESLRAGAA